MGYRVKEIREQKKMTQEELELLGVSLTQLGDTILTIVTQKSICCK